MIFSRNVTKLCHFGGIEAALLLGERGQPMKFSSGFSKPIFLVLLAVTLLGRSAQARPSDDHSLPMAHKQGNPVLVSVTDSDGKVHQRGMGSVIELDGNYYLVGNKDVFQGVQGMSGGDSSSAGPQGVTVFYPWMTRKPDGTTGNPVYNCSSTDGRIAVIHGDIGILQLRANPPPCMSHRYP